MWAASATAKDLARRLLLPWAAIALAAQLLATELSQLMAAEPTVAQQTQVRVVEAAIKRAGNLYRSKKFAESGKAVKEAQEKLDRLAEEKSEELDKLTAPLARQLARARQLLADEGILVAAGKPPSEPAQASSVRFTRQIAPLLVAKCGSCHIQRSRGEFNMSTYVSLSKGSADGPVIVAGEARASRLFELLTRGDMPKGGSKLSADEIALVREWIDGGAKFDGPDSAAPLSSFAPDKPAAPAPRPDVVRASGKEEVQFARDLGGLLLAQCRQCHGEDNPRNGFSIETFNRLLAGGDNGPPIVPRKSQESLLVKKLRGTMGARMPLQRPPLANEDIARIEKWIDAGARFDGTDADARLSETVEQVVAAGESHDELSKRRSALADKNWKLILPDAKPVHEETSNFLLYGSVRPELLAEVARVAEEQTLKLRKLFKTSADKPFIHGRLTLYVFDKRYDYGEVGAMLERRELPSTWRGHWHFTPVDAYGCLLLVGDKAPPGLVAQQLAGSYLASRGKSPRWFAEGAARAVAARVEPKDPRVKLWDDQVARILAASPKPEAFLSGGISPEDADILSYSFVKYLMLQAARFSALVAALDAGTTFDAAFAKAYGASPEEIVPQWAERAPKRGRS
jgi:mono/diheme cytochrome c family protein